MSPVCADGVAYGHMLAVVAAEKLYGDNSGCLWWVAVFVLDVWGFSVPVANMGSRLH